MKYYRIKQKETSRNVIRPVFPSLTEIWSENQPLFIKGSVKKTVNEIVFLPFYSSHTFLILDEMKRIWTKYQLGGTYRPCSLGSIEQRIVKAYWFMKPIILEAVHESTVYYKSGDIEKLCLDRDIVKKNKVFGIRRWHHIDLILSEDILEEMLQQRITEFHWNEIESYQGELMYE